METSHPSTAQPVPTPPQNRVGKIISVSKSMGDAVAAIGKFLLYGFLILSFAGILGGLGNSSSPVATQSKLFGQGEDKVAVVTLSGTILEDAGSGSLGTFDTQVISPQKLLQFFEQIQQDRSIKAVVLRINSPGGSVTASEEIYQLIRRFKQQTHIPVIASMGEVAASGGYYIALAADTVVADGATLTGSIGVVVSTYNVKDLADAYGVKSVVISSGDNKAFLDPLQEVDPVQVEILQTIVGEAHEQFLTRVLENRDISEERLRELADGRPLSGSQALTDNLVDRLGTFHESVELAKAHAGLTQATVIEYSFGGLLQSLLGYAGERLSPWSVLPRPLTHSLGGTPLYLYSL